MIDNKKIADLRLALIRAEVHKGSRTETALLAEVRPVIGELLALADAALKIRTVCRQQGSNVRSSGGQQVVLSVVLGAMSDLDYLEGASRG